MKTLHLRSKFTNGTRALFYVSEWYIYYGYLKDIVELLLDHTIVDLKTLTHFGGTANKSIFQQLYNGRLRWNQNELSEMIQLLKNFGFNINEQESDGWNALHSLMDPIYMDENRTAAVRVLIESGINVNAKVKDGENALQVLFNFSHFGNAFNSHHQWTPIHDALDIAKILIENGLDVNLKNENGENTLLSLLIGYRGGNMIEIARIIIENGIDINSKSKEGRNALHYLLMNFYDRDIIAIEILKMLLEAGIDVNAADAENGWNGLFFFKFFYGGSHLQGSNVIMAKMLIAKGINVNARDKSGHTILHYLLSRRDSMNTSLEMIELLKSHNGIV